MEDDSNSVTEAQAERLLAVVRGNDVDQKVNEFEKIRSSIKHANLKPEAIFPVFEACRIGVASSNNVLLPKALQCLSVLIKRAARQEPSSVRKQAAHIIPLLIERLSDSKDRNRTLASQSLVEAWKTVGAEVEKGIKEVGFVHKSPRVRAESVGWLQQAYATQQLNGATLSIKSFTPSLVNLLEDADGTVREATKEVVVDLFRNAPERAKWDLKKKLGERGVRKTISNDIVARLGVPGSGGNEADIRVSVKSNDGTEDDASSRHGGGAKSTTGGSVAGSMASSTYVASLTGAEMEVMEPVYVATNRELEGLFESMRGCFEGRESEQNWAARDRNITKLRQLTRGNAYPDYQQTFLAGIKSLLDGILKTVNSLRTTVSSNGCQLVKDLTISVGPGLDPMVEILLANFVKLCANTKKITAHNGNLVTALILAHVSFHPNIIKHILGACGDKNVSPRLNATNWIMVLLEAHADHSRTMEHGGSVDMLETCINKGLADPNPGVRESMRKTYWKFQSIWPERAEKILNKLQGAHKTNLEKANPNGATAVSQSSASTLRAPSRGAPTRPSIREAILAQRKSKGNLRAKSESAEPVEPPASISSAARRPNHLGQSRTVPDRQDFPTMASRMASPALTTRSGMTPMVSRAGRGPAPSTSPRANRGTSQRPSTLSSNRKMTMLEQLNSVDWHVRVEGIVTVACILAKRTPPGYDGQKMPTLPPSDVFAPTLAKLLNDPQPEVVEHVVAPEVLAELAKVVPMEQIIPKVLLLSEGDDAEHAQPIAAASLPALKQLINDTESTELLIKLITTMGAPGVGARKLTAGSFNPTQKRRIIHGCLLWLNENVERYNKGIVNEYLGELNLYKTMVNRLTGMLNGTKAPNYQPLTALLKNLETLNPQVFNKILGTFDASAVKDLRRAWGVNVEDDTEQIVIEEKVAGVEQVLGSVPEVGGTTRRPYHGEISPPILSPTFSKSSNGLDEEDLTMIAAPPAPRPVTPPALTEEDHAHLETLPALPSTPAEIPEEFLRKVNFSPPKKTPGKPAMKVYQDPPDQMVESNGAVATSMTPLKSPVLPPFNKLRKQLSGSDLPKSPEKASRRLASMMLRLQNKDLDAQGFKKLIGIVRENPVRTALQEQNGEANYDIWEGGSVFDELVISLLEYLLEVDVKGEDVSSLKVQGLSLLKQIFTKGGTYLPRHEATVLQTLINLRAKYPEQSHVVTGIEEFSDEFLAAADATNCINAIMELMMPETDPGFRADPESACFALNCMASFVRSAKMNVLEPLLPRIGELAIKSLEEEDPEVRRSSVAMCIELHSKLSNDDKLFGEVLKGVKSAHQNLLMYYFARKQDDSRQ